MTEISGNRAGENESGGRQRTRAPFGLDDKLVLFDGECNLCSRWVRLIIRFDPDARLRLCAQQSEEGHAVMAWVGKTREELQSIVVIDENRIYVRSDAVIRMARYFRFPLSLLRAVALVPRFLREWGYRLVSANRYRIYGRRDTCLVPTPDVQRHFFRLDSTL